MGPLLQRQHAAGREEPAPGYKQLMRVEECWRTMKSGLRTRPIVLWTPHRISSHISLCVLALLLEGVDERRTGDSWRNLVAQLDTLQVVEYKRGNTRIRQTTELRGEVGALLRRLEVPRRPGCTRWQTAPSPSTTALPPDSRVSRTNYETNCS